MEEKNKSLRINHKLLFTISIVSLAITIILIFTNLTKIQQVISSEENLEFPQEYRIISPEVPKEIDFAGEPVPLHKYDVYERFDREIIVNTYWHSSTIFGIKRANRWFPEIEKILKENGIPDDFKYLALIESGFENLISPAGAVGFWQFTEGAAKKYGLEINDEVDERYNAEKSTIAATMYLKDSYKVYNSWTLSAATYNAGMWGIERQIVKQKENDYYDLLFSAETMRYVFRILAMKQIFSNPKKYGFDIKEDQLYSVIKTKDVKVNYRIENLADFAKSQGINYKILKYFNPWLRGNSLTNKSGKTYTIKIPENTKNWL